MTDLLDRFPGLVCPSCRGPALETAGDRVVCRACEEGYDLVAGRFPRLIPPAAQVSSDEVAVQDRVAEWYEDVRYRNPWSRAYHQWVNDAIVSQVDVSGRILDNGCGVGHLLDQLREADITGIDLSPEMIVIASRYDDRVLLADSQYLPFADDTFDTVIARGVLHHLPDPERGLSEMARVLRPGGEVVTVDTNRSLLSALPRAIANRGEHFSEQHKNLHRGELIRTFRRFFDVELVRFFGYLAYPILGFPDVTDAFRFFPAKRLTYKLLMGLDEVLARVPLIRKHSWGVLIKGRTPVAG